MKRQSDSQLPDAKRQRDESLEQLVGLRASEDGRKILMYLFVVCECDVPIIESLFYTTFAYWRVLGTKYISGAGYACQVISSQLSQWIVDEVCACLPDYAYFMREDGKSAWANQERFIMLFVGPQTDKSEKIWLASNHRKVFYVVWDYTRFGNVIHMFTNDKNLGPQRHEDFLLQLRKGLGDFCRGVAT